MPQIVIADDQQLYIDAIKMFLEEESSIQIVGEALNGQLLLDLLEKIKADVILLDIHIPILNGIEVANQNRKHYITRLIAAGVNGYILKTTGKDELLQAIQAVHNGETFYSVDVIAEVMESFRNNNATNPLHLELTKREEEVLQLLAQDRTGMEIAQVLNISHHTVDAHRKNMLSKFNVRTTVGLIKLAIEND